eukprot:921318-Rhodomonas_salina.2
MSATTAAATAAAVAACSLCKRVGTWYRDGYPGTGILAGTGVLRVPRVASLDPGYPGTGNPGYRVLGTRVGIPTWVNTGVKRRFEGSETIH